jgi:hypothetical protein
VEQRAARGSSPTSRVIAFVALQSSHGEEGRSSVSLLNSGSDVAVATGAFIPHREVIVDAERFRSAWEQR